MKILIGDKGNIDFDGPIRMSSEQKKQFIKLMKNLFAVVVKEECDELRIHRLGDKMFARTWTSNELKLLLEIKDTDKIAQELGRSWMSVDIKRGEFIPEFMMWAHDKNYNILYDDTKKLIEEFMEEKEKLKQERRNEKKKLPNLKQEREKLKKTLKRTELRIRCGITSSNDDNIIAKIKKEIKEVDEKIKFLEENLD